MTEIYRYSRLTIGHWFPSPIWVAVLDDKPPGNGIVLVAPNKPVVREMVGVKAVRVWFMQGDPFYIERPGAARDGVIRDRLTLELVPDDVAAAWMKMHHTGRIK